VIRIGDFKNPKNSRPNQTWFHQKQKRPQKKKLGPKVPFEIRNCTTLVYTFTLGLEFFKTYIR
jgi:hypothetical protein